MDGAYQSIVENRYVTINFWLYGMGRREMKVADPCASAVCGRSLAGIVCSNPAWGIDDCLSLSVSLLNVLCCQVEFPATGRSLFQRSSTQCMCQRR